MAYDPTRGKLAEKVLGDWDSLPESFKAALIAYISGNSNVVIDRSQLPRDVQSATFGTMAAGPPITPFHNQRWIATDVDAFGAVWEFRYNALSSSAYKWESVGGPPMFVEISTDESTASTTYAALATAGPTITLPRPGDYLVSIASDIYATVAANISMSYDIGGTGAVDADRAYLEQSAGVATYFERTTRTLRKTGLTAVALTAKYKTNVGTAHFKSREMSVLPVRIS